jgi:hypothetical protein
MLHLAPLVDMAYIICMDCESLTFSASVKNVRLVSGAASDKCSSLDDYHARVGFSHKAAVADAQANNYSSILIAEDDATLNHLPDLTQLKAKVAMKWEENAHQLVRLTALPWDTVDATGSCRSEKCNCRHGQDNIFCSLQKGCEMVHDSSLYMIAQPAYSAFIATGGQIDVHLFARFDSLLVTPPVSLQHCWTWKPKAMLVSIAGQRSSQQRACDGDEIMQKKKWDQYEKACIVSQQSMAQHDFSLQRILPALRYFFSFLHIEM